MANRVRIVIVEDHFATLDGLVLGLSQEPDFEVVGSTAEGEIGLSLVDETKPDVLLLDLHLKKTVRPTDLIREFLRYPTMRVVIFSAENRLAYVQSVLSMGVAAYLLKDERVKSVAEIIRRVMRGETGIISSDLSNEYKKITPAEQEVLHMLGRGMKYQEIADERCTSAATARKQCEVLLLKLNLENREQLIAWAVKNGYGTIEAT